MNEKRIIFRIQYCVCLCASALWLMSCGVNVWQPNKSLAPHANRIEIGVDEEVFDATHRYRIRIDSIISDTRCPKNAHCTWQGNAQVRLCIYSGNAYKTIFTLHTHPNSKQDTVVQGIAYKLIDLTPYPIDKEVIRYADYKAVISYKKL